MGKAGRGGHPEFTIPRFQKINRPVVRKPPISPEVGEGVAVEAG
jgi:hypothetical protein